MKIVPGVFRRCQAFAGLGLTGICSLACTGLVGGGGPYGASGGSGQSVGGSENAGGGASGNGTGMPVGASQGGAKLRVLTQSEYQNALSYLLGPISAQLPLPDDLYSAGFSAVGAAEVAINAPSVPLYETASLTAAAEVFGETARWQKLVGCQPKADLSDACVGTFIQSFGKRAFRRDLSAAEVQRWLQAGQSIAQLPGSSAAQGLATIVSGLLQ